MVVATINCTIAAFVIAIFWNGVCTGLAAEGHPSLA